MKDDWKTFALFLIVGLVGGAVLAWGVLQIGIRDSHRTIERMESTNRELESQLGDVQAAVDSVGTNLEGASETVGGVADEVSDVVGGLDDSIRTLEQLIDFFGRVERILASADARLSP